MKVIKEIGNKLTLLSNMTDAGWSRQYDFYIILDRLTQINPLGKRQLEIWFWTIFELLIKQTENFKETGLRVVRYKPEKRVSKKDSKEFIYHSEIKLGRLKWDEKSHEKWTVNNNLENYFLNFELWTPIWTICDKNKLPQTFSLQ